MLLCVAYKDSISLHSLLLFAFFVKWSSQVSVPYFLYNLIDIPVSKVLSKSKRWDQISYDIFWLKIPLDLCKKRLCLEIRRIEHFRFLPLVILTRHNNYRIAFRNYLISKIFKNLYLYFRSGVQALIGSSNKYYKNEIISKIERNVRYLWNNNRKLVLPD